MNFVIYLFLRGNLLILNDLPVYMRMTSSNEKLDHEFENPMLIAIATNYNSLNQVEREETCLETYDSGNEGGYQHNEFLQQ